MTLDPSLRAELTQCCSRLAENRLTAAEALRLEDLVAGNPAARDYFLLQQMLRAELELHYGVIDMHAAPQAPSSRPPRWLRRACKALLRPTPLSYTIATLVMGLLLVALAFVAVPRFSGTDHAAMPAAPVFAAQLTGMRAVVWSDGQIQRRLGARLLSGQRLALQSGFAEITFDSGAKVLLEGKNELHIVSSNGAALDQGRLVAQVPAQARGFTVSTPTMEVVDLGTEFGLEVDDQQRGSLTVFQGVVTLAAKRAGVAQTPQRLVAGQSASVFGTRIASTPATPVPSAHRFAAFAREMPAPIMQEVTSSTGRMYRVATAGLHEDARAYTDELHEWNGIDTGGLPAELLGAEYLRTANADRNTASYDVTLRISRPARLYVFWSKNVTPPEWLARDFVDSGLLIGLDAVAGRGWPKTPGVGPGKSIDIVQRVWKREITEPQVIQLGPTKQRGTAVFGIAALPLAEASP
jgi:hypothetical protein